MNKWLRLFLLGAHIGVGSTIFAQEATKVVSNTDHRVLQVTGIDQYAQLIISGDYPETWNVEGKGRCVTVDGFTDDFVIVCKGGKLKLYQMDANGGHHLVRTSNGPLAILERDCPFFYSGNSDLGFVP